MTAISLSVDPESRDNYGPYVPNIGAVNPSTGNPIRYNNVADLEAVLEAHGKDTAAFIVEPIQGEAGVVVPDDDYLSKVAELCKKHNVLFICDEIQTGIARTGRLLCSEWAGVKPDMVTLGKAISGGMYPVSCVLGRKDVMLVIEPGTHGSTYGGNPLGCALSLRALELVEEEKMMERSEDLGNIFRDGLAAFNSPIIQTIRGKGLLNAVVIDEAAAGGRTAWDVCILLKEKGLLVSDSWLTIMRLLSSTKRRLTVHARETGQADPRQHHPVHSPVNHHRGGATQGDRHHWGSVEGAAYGEEGRGALALAWIIKKGGLFYGRSIRLG